MRAAGLRPFDFALSKIPTSRAKNAREMGHPAAVATRAYSSNIILQTLLFFKHYSSNIIPQTWELGVDPVRRDAGGGWRR